MAMAGLAAMLPPFCQRYFLVLSSYHHLPIVRHQLSHSLSTSADELLLNLPPPTGVSSKLEQVLLTQRSEDFSRRSTIAKVAESDKFLMLCRKPHPVRFGGRREGYDTGLFL